MISRVWWKVFETFMSFCFMTANVKASCGVDCGECHKWLSFSDFVENIFILNKKLSLGRSFSRELWKLNFVSFISFFTFYSKWNSSQARFWEFLNKFLAYEDCTLLQILKKGYKVPQYCAFQNAISMKSNPFIKIKQVIWQKLKKWNFLFSINFWSPMTQNLLKNYVSY